MRHTLTDALATLAKRRRQPSETRMIDDQQLRELLPRLRRFALSLSRQPACADDLVQATLSAPCRAGPANERTAICAPGCSAFSIGNFSTLSAEPNAMPGCWPCLPRKPAPSPEQHWEAHATLQAFNQLPDEQRALLLLVSVEG